MLNNKIEKFLENKNMTYLFMILSNLEVERLSNLPFTTKKSLGKKITEVALNNVIQNKIPDYIMMEEDTDEEVSG
ncbi:MAG: hypothetical protein HQ534_13385 [Armatimonadetes bacterium]|nr:hypothetical protein [Armatimonadota bacterium]